MRPSIKVGLKVSLNVYRVNRPTTVLLDDQQNTAGFRTILPQLMDQTDCLISSGCYLFGGGDGLFDHGDPHRWPELKASNGFRLLLNQLRDKYRVKTVGEEDKRKNNGRRWTHGDVDVARQLNSIE